MPDALRPPRSARRAALALAGGAAVAAAAVAGCAGRAAPSPARIDPAFVAPVYDPGARELTADAQIRQALARVTFGARPGDAARVRALGVDRWVDQQLFPERIPDPAGDAAAARYPALGMSGAALLAQFPPPNQAVKRAAAAGPLTAADSAELRRMAREANRFSADLQAARVARAVAGERQLQEVMTDFWLNHFNVYAGKDRVRYYLPEYEATVRARAMGRFRDLLGAVAHSPAMLLYLDNWQSTADSARPTLAAARAPRARPALNANGKVPKPRRGGLNENYGRELLELHTLGVDGGYTQQDVLNTARALTGWTLWPADRGGGFRFRPEVHDAGEKVILGQRFPAGGGEEEGERVLDLLARSPATARHLATKLAVRFVSDTPPPALVDRAAQAYLRTGGDVRSTLAVILHSSEFYSRAAYRAKVKTPFELVASAARALGAPADTTPRTAQLVGRLGQPLYGHQAPDGWPEQGEPWMNTGAILARINFGTAVATGRVPTIRPADWPEAAALRAAPRAAQIDGVVAALLGGEASPDTRAILARGENPLAAAPAAADSAPARRPARPGDPLADLVGLALGAPEFQRR